MALFETLPALKKSAATQPKVCPTCGGLERFERPRYFSGQLLTDKDLDAAQRYVIEKNKLHNRYAVGAGVVCGLAVRCHATKPCAVVVEPGYALDCCGNDLVLGEPAEFNVCDYLEACRKGEVRCDDKMRSSRSRQDDSPKEHYCLFLSYNEEPLRPMTAMIRNNGSTSPRCEPSRTRETWRFDLVDQEDLEARKPAPTLVERLPELLDAPAKKLKGFVSHLADIQKNLFTNERRQFHEKVRDVLGEMRADLLQHAEKGPRVDGDLAGKLHEIAQSFPAFDDEHYLRKVHHTMFNAGALYFRHAVDTICDALLVPCLPRQEPEGVLLACMTVQNEKILSISNAVRTQIITGPALRYWQFPLRTLMGDLLKSRCRGIDPASLIRGPEIFTPRNLPVRYFSASHWQDLNAAEWLQFVNPNTVTAVELYDRPLSHAKDELRKINIEIKDEDVIKPGENRDLPFSLENLAELTWIVMPESKVELIVAGVEPPFQVTSIQKKGGGQ